MSELLAMPPFGPRDQAAFVAELNTLVHHHRAGCAPYAALASERPFDRVQDAPFVHVGLFKHLTLRTDGVRHGRTLLSSATSSGVSSQIALDERSSQLQRTSVIHILQDWIGPATARPLLILDSVKALRSRQVSARVAAALSIKPLASDLWFVIPQVGSTSIDWSLVNKVLRAHDEVLIYGFTWLLWVAWAREDIPDRVVEALSTTRVHFIHSGGWKKLSRLRVDRHTLSQTLLQHTGAGSTVVDYYGMVEQVGVIYPECSEGFRHVPVWADVLVRDVYTGKSEPTEPGALQLLNVLAWGGPYHSVLTEDQGRIVPGSCACGRRSKRFVLLGRLPKAELRGCANV